MLGWDGLGCLRHGFNARYSVPCHTHPPPTLLLVVANPIPADKEIHSEESRLAGKVSNIIKSENVVREGRNGSEPFEEGDIG